MLLEFELKNCSRVCAATTRPLNPGEVYFSVLLTAGNDFARQDYSVDAWQGPPEDCIGWWRSRVPTKDDTQPRLAPTDVMLNLFEALEGRPTELAFRYLLGLLLLRRKILRRDESRRDDQGREVLTMHCQRRQKDYDLVVAEPEAEHAAKLQEQMVNLLYGNSEPSTRSQTTVISELTE
jgi:hypothetical protein